MTAWLLEPRGKSEQYTSKQNYQKISPEKKTMHFLLMKEEKHPQFFSFNERGKTSSILWG
jgi:hypothetical protein